jgi:GTP-binding protein
LIDRSHIYVKGGDGGNGIVSFRREKYIPFGGPDGGDGGDGGSIYIMGDRGIATLRQFRYKRNFRAGRGAHGKGKNMHGRRGEDITIYVPVGTLVKRSNEGDKDVIVDDIVQHEQRVLVAEGGKGGRGNARFASPTDQAPRTAEPGSPGEESTLVLDLKLIADVGVVGYPNAGKSTLVSAVSRATPKVAEYPFTTLEPVLGVVEIGYRSFVIADIPGIIEGAHRGLGLGLDFLRHIERTKTIIQIIDGSSDKVLSDLKAIEAEMEAYGEGLGDKPRIVALNKIDIPEVRERLRKIRSELQDIGVDVYFISAATGEGVDELMKKTLEMLSRADSAAPIPSGQKEEDEFKVYRPHPLSPKKATRRGGRHG